MKERDKANDASAWDGSRDSLTPVDVQQKEFRVARLGAGYRMREVDEFLDQVTDTLSSLLAENERLRAGGTGQSAPPAVAPPVAFRPGGSPPRVERVAPDDLVGAALRVALELSREDGLLAVILPEPLVPHVEPVTR